MKPRQPVGASVASMTRCQFQLRLLPGENEKSAPPYLFSFGEEVFYWR